MAQGKSSESGNHSADSTMGQLRVEQQSNDILGISIQWLFESRSVRITRWTCNALTKGLTPERCQKWHAFGFLHAGAYELRDRRGTSLVDCTRVAFFSPTAPYQTSHPFGLGDRGSFFVVAPETLRELIALYEPSLEDHLDASLPIAHSPVSGPTLLRHRRLLRRLEALTLTDPVEVEEEALALAASVVREASSMHGVRRRSSRAAARRRDIAEAARGFLVEGFGGVRRLSDVARVTGASVFHLCRIFKSEMGCTIHSYLNQLRLRAALDQLPDRGGDLTTLASEVGFSSHSHFTAAFRREFGVPPSAIDSSIRATSR